MKKRNVEHAREAGGSRHRGKKEKKSKRNVIEVTTRLPSGYLFKYSWAVLACTSPVTLHYISKHW